MKKSLVALCLGMLLVGNANATRGHPRPTAPFTTEAERCILPAAQYHSVNAHVLRAILKIESGLNPKAVGRNKNGTVDVGLGQINSMHFGELAKKGIRHQDLLDVCVGTYVAAWHLARVLSASGNTWEGVASYHSKTPYFNQRYQIMLTNELIRSKVMTGVIQPVPPLKNAKNTSVGTAGVRSRQQLSSASSVVVDIGDAEKATAREAE